MLIRHPSPEISTAAPPATTRRDAVRRFVEDRLAVPPVDPRRPALHRHGLAPRRHREDHRRRVVERHVAVHVPRPARRDRAAVVPAVRGRRGRAQRPPDIRRRGGGPAVRRRHPAVREEPAGRYRRRRVPEPQLRRNRRGRPVHLLPDLPAAILLWALHGARTRSFRLLATGSVALAALNLPFVSTLDPHEVIQDPGDHPGDPRPAGRHDKRPVRVAVPHPSPPGGGHLAPFPQ